MPDQFTRSAMLYGQANIEKLKASRVAVFGLGGVGGHCAEALCRMGIGTIGLIDGDTINVTNINRQIIATHKTIGKAKTEAMSERLRDINPNIKIQAHNLFYLPDTANIVDLTAYDYIVDAVDTITAKIEIICRAKALGIPVISSMGAANKHDPTAFEVADIYATAVCPIARILRHELRKRGITALKVVYSKEPPEKPAFDRINDLEINDLETNDLGPNDLETNAPGTNDQKRQRRIPASNSFVPPVAGLILAGEVIKDILNSSHDWQIRQ